MLNKSITYVDFNKQEVTEEFYFHLYEADVIDMQFGTEGGLKDYLEKIFAEQDSAKIYNWLKMIILKSVGHKSPDGRRFITNAAISEDFESSPAFSRLIMGFLKDANEAAKFINGIMPEGMQEELAEIVEHQERQPNRAERRHPTNLGPRPAVSQPEGSETMETQMEPRGDWNVFSAENPKILTRAELVEMDSEELRSGLAEGRYKLQ